jgi:hypothetical protein
MRLLPPLLSLLVLASAAQAQPSAERLFYGWLDAQREATREAVGAGPPVMTFTERAERRIDGLRGERVIETEAFVTWDGDGLYHDVLRARVDGQELSPEDVDRLEDRLDEAHGPELRLLRRAPILSSRLFGGFAPTGPAKRVERDGQTLWRVPVEPDEPRPERPRARLFFASDGAGAPRLLAAELSLAPPPSPPRRRPGRRRAPPPPDIRVDIEAQFQRSPGGLDLAARQRVEAVVQQRRRLRQFSVSVVADLRFSDYQLRPRR